MTGDSISAGRLGNSAAFTLESPVSDPCRGTGGGFTCRGGCGFSGDGGLSPLRRLEGRGQVHDRLQRRQRLPPGRLDVLGILQHRPKSHYSLQREICALPLTQKLNGVQREQKKTHAHPCPFLEPEQALPQSGKPSMCAPHQHWHVQMHGPLEQQE